MTFNVAFIWQIYFVDVAHNSTNWRICNYPLPRIDEMLDALQDAQWFTTLDLASGYWQIKVKKKDQEKTAFITKFETYEFKVMPFGLCNAPATFQRTMDKVL
jgi:hypothetical protein